MLLALSDDFSDNFLILKDIEEEGRLDINEKKSVRKTVANKPFLDKDLESYSNSEFNSKSVKNSKVNHLESNDSLFLKSSKASICLNGLVAIFSISYAREKLIRILNGDTLISKQR